MNVVILNVDNTRTIEYFTNPQFLSMLAATHRGELTIWYNELNDDNNEYREDAANVETMFTVTNPDCMGFACACQCAFCQGINDNFCGGDILENPHDGELDVENHVLWREGFAFADQ